jgi:uncharacterized protein YdiU (UPF0061 family)
MEDIIGGIKSKKLPINKDATFQKKPLKITLPLTPTTLIKNTNKKPVEIEKNIIVKQENLVVKNSITDLLNFIDVDKLVDTKSSRYSDTYELKDLKNLAKDLGMSYNNINKKALIDKIKDLLNKTFNNQPNLIGDLKALETLTPTNIEQLLITHRISRDKAHMINTEVSTILKRKDDVEKLKSIVRLLEMEWKKRL